MTKMIKDLIMLTTMYPAKEILAHALPWKDYLEISDEASSLLITVHWQAAHWRLRGLSELHLSSLW